jgi:hypothetical protein
MEHSHPASAHAAVPVSHAVEVVAVDSATADDVRELHPNRLSLALSVFVLMAITSAVLADVHEQKSFASPEEGMSALVEAVRANDQPAVLALLGAGGQDLIDSGDPAADAQRRKAFLKAYAAANKIVLEENSTRAVLVIGRNEWPMPIPLVKSTAGWRFDTQHAAEEILRRHIGRNELAAIQVCLAIVDAEHEYAAQDPDGDGIPGYASKFASSAGKRDGLYWETVEGEPLSPLGPLLAAAVREENKMSDSAAIEPYHGYFYRMLAQQGKDASGGAHDYQINGKMIGGFAVVAYPARYGVSGVVSFIVNQDGVIYQKDLGPNTTALASEMAAFNPDPSWKRAP